MSDATTDPVSVENSLLGLSLLEGMLDPEHEDTYATLLEQHDHDELIDLLIQFSLQWLAHESRVHEVPMTGYLRQLRADFLQRAVDKAQESGADQP